jgi:hypothetical protein
MTPKKEKIVTQREAARLAGVTQKSISSLRKSERWGFFVGTKVNILHQSWFAYLRTRGLSPFGQMAQNNGDNGDSSDNGHDFPPDENDADENVEIVEEYDYILEWKKWRAAVTEENAKKKKLEREKLEGSLIPIDFVQKLIEDYIALLHKRFLDLPRDKIDRIMQIFQAGGDDIQANIVKTLTREIELNLKQTKREIKQSFDKYQKEL